LGGFRTNFPPRGSSGSLAPSPGGLAVTDAPPEAAALGSSVGALSGLR